MKYGIVYGAALTLILSNPIWAQQEQESREYTFTDLPGIILTGVKAGQTPASVTIITSEDIYNTPARNLEDLLEVYVPGASWTNHIEDPHPTLRGIAMDRNVKFLLLVNGRNMNQKAHNGANSELTHWDLGDIERIEVIRGPGSVTYGPGAIQSVINIITKSANTVGIQQGAGLQYMNEYASTGARAYLSTEKGKFDFYVYGSVVSTRGDRDSKGYAVDAGNGRAGYVGRDFNTTSAIQAASTLGEIKYKNADQFRDYDDEPQVKLYVQAQAGDQWNFWARYTRSGTTVNGALSQVKKPDGSFYNLAQFRVRQLTLEGENKLTLSDALSLKTTLSWDSNDNDRGRPQLNPFTDEIENSANQRQNYREDECFLRSILNVTLSDKLKSALGFEYSHESWGKGWGDDWDDFRMGDAQRIVNGPANHAVLNSSATEGNVPFVYASHGWSMNTYSLLAEINIEFVPCFNLLLSARLDKSDYSTELFSPRAAFYWDLEDKGFLKCIVQRSVRMNTASQLYLQHLADTESDPESLKGVELIYSKNILQKSEVSLSGYYNVMEALSWNGSTFGVDQAGELKLYGLEAEYRYKEENWNAGINHSYVKQVDWTLGPKATGSGVSFSDYRRVIRDGIVLKGSGNDINNLPQQATKFFSNFYLMDRKLTLHLDARVFWSFPGNDAGLDMLLESTQGTTWESLTNASVSQVLDHGVYDPDFRLNASISYQWTENWSAGLYILNVLGYNHNFRYNHDGGLGDPVPSRTRVIEEPTAVGVRVDWKV